MKNLLLVSVLLTSTSLFATENSTTSMILVPSKDTAQACSDLSVWGPATLNTQASTQKMELKLEIGGTYEMKATAAGLVSKTQFQDEGYSSTTIVTLNTATKSYDVQFIETDGRGHRSQVTCVGKVELN